MATFKKILFAAFLFSLLFAALGIVYAKQEVDITLPGYSPGKPPGQFINSFYQFSLAIGGVLAFGAIVYGGIKYTFAAGNPAGQSEGKEWIRGALWGLLLLASAYLILNTINPKIVDLTLLTLTEPTPPTTTDTTNLLERSESSNPACSNESAGTTKYVIKTPVPQGCAGRGTTYRVLPGDKNLPSKLECFNKYDC